MKRMGSGLRGVTLGRIDERHRQSLPALFAFRLSRQLQLFGVLRADQLLAGLGL